MSQVQKITKYCAMALAIFLTVNILGLIFMGIVAIGNLFYSDEKDVLTDKLEVVDISGNSFTDLEIETVSVNIIIKESDDFKVETNNKYIKLNERGNKLKIEEEKHIFTNTISSLVIYVPRDTLFNDISIESGAGKVEINSLTAREVSLDLGAGKVDIDNLVVIDEADIDGSAGAIVINNGNINNLDLDMGVGKLTMMAQVTGRGDIDAGVGECDITLVGSKADYRIKVNKGIGNVLVGGDNVENNTYYGSGSNTILIDGGVGNIDIKFTLE